MRPDENRASFVRCCAGECVTAEIDARHSWANIRIDAAEADDIHSADFELHIGPQYVHSETVVDLIQQLSGGQQPDRLTPVK